MKKLLMFFLLIYTYCISQEGWFRLNSPTNKQLRFIDFINKDFGIIGGDSCLFITTDGGMSFKNIATNQSNLEYSSVLIINEKEIYISGIENNNKNTFKNFIKKTTNYGLSWELLYNELTNEKVSLQSLQLCNVNVYFASQNIKPKIIINHTNIFILPYSYFQCNGEYYGLIFGSTDIQTGALKDFVLKIFRDSTNVGFYNFESPNLSSFLAYERSWFVNDYEGQFKSWDNGKNWSKISNFNLQTYLGTEFFFKQDTGYYYIFSTNIYKSNDFQNILKCKIPIGIPWIKSLKSVDKNIAYAVGDSGLILKTTDGGGVLTSIEDEEIKESQEIKILNDLNTVSFSLELKFPPNEATIEIINLLGVPIFSQNIPSQFTNISLEPYFQGIYFLKYTDKHSTQVFKLLRE